MCQRVAELWLVMWSFESYWLFSQPSPFLAGLALAAGICISLLDLRFYCYCVYCICWERCPSWSKVDLLVEELHHFEMSITGISGLVKMAMRWMGLSWSILADLFQQKGCFTEPSIGWTDHRLLTSTLRYRPLVTHQYVRHRFAAYKLRDWNLGLACNEEVVERVYTMWNDAMCTQQKWKVLHDGFVAGAAGSATWWGLSSTARLIYG